jgi:hypothetical protein
MCVRNTPDEVTLNKPFQCLLLQYNYRTHYVLLMQQVTLGNGASRRGSIDIEKKFKGIIDFESLTRMKGYCLMDDRQTDDRQMRLRTLDSHHAKLLTRLDIRNSFCL